MARAHTPLETALSAGLPETGTLVVAVSGGADSVALLRAIHALWLRAGQAAKEPAQAHRDARVPRRNQTAARTKRSIVVLHVNHRLRATAERDERFVIALAKRLKVRCVVRRLRRAPSSNIEAWARRYRYEALERCRVQCQAGWILTAHTRDDVAETFLIKLLQNRDSSLLAPIDASRRLLRPLVAIGRDQIEAYLNNLDQAWCEDESNKDLSFARNWVRAVLLPLLRDRWGSGVQRTLVERAEAQRADRLMSAALIDGMLAQHPARALSWIETLRGLMAQLPEAGYPLLGCAVLQRRYGVTIGRTHGLAVAQLIGGAVTAVQLPGDKHLNILRGRLNLVSLKGRAP